MSAFTALIVACGLFAALAAIEYVRPDRPPAYRRWPLNLSLGLLTLLIGRALATAAPLAAALWADEQGFGLLHFVDLPTPVVGLLAVIGMDCAVYWQHRAFHRINFFWRWHRLHHEDEALDLSTGLRFHPVEALLSLFWKSASAALLGIPVWAVPLFELWLMAGSLFEHANIRIPASADRVLRMALVTPAMHRVHHSAHCNDADRNFGFAISLWDHWFGSYRQSPSGPDIGVIKAG